MDEIYHVYILTNKNNNVLYTGVTSDLQNRVLEHKTKLLVDSLLNTMSINWCTLKPLMTLQKPSLAKNNSRLDHARRNWS